VIVIVTTFYSWIKCKNEKTDNMPNKRKTMATFVKYIMDIYFERLAIEHKYDKYLLQQLWDETNTIMKNVLFEFIGTNFPSIINEKAQSKTCNHKYHKKGELKSCSHKVSGPNRKTCYRHTPELQTILKKKKSPKEEEIVCDVTTNQST
jgi:hypothetical protein